MNWRNSRNYVPLLAVMLLACSSEPGETMASGSGGPTDQPSGGTTGDLSSVATGGTSGTGAEAGTTSGGTTSDSGGSGGTSNGTGRTSTEDGDELVGWASVDSCGATGTTGGGAGPATVTVTSGSELRTALETSGPLVITVSGQFSSPGEISGATDKTLLGQNDAEVSGGFVLKNSQNVIIKNIKFVDGSDDTFELTGSSCVWFDHCEFVDGADGNLDIVRASDFVTVSWSRFYYTRGHSHMLSNLTGNGDNRDSDEGKLNVTFHHNWWGAGVKERMPRVRYGKVHVFNNYYKYESVSGDAGQNYCIAAGQHANLLVENNYFDGSEDPIIYQTNGEGTAEVTHSGNEFVETSGTTVSTGGAFTPPYAYTPDAGIDVKALVTAGAGRR